MITHEEARIEAVSYNHEAIRVILKYISQQETLQAEHEALKKELAKSVGYCSKIQNEFNTLKNDVARYFELFWENLDVNETNEFYELEEKLKKVGKEE